MLIAPPGWMQIRRPRVSLCIGDPRALVCLRARADGLYPDPAQRRRRGRRPASPAHACLCLSRLNLRNDRPRELLLIFDSFSRVLYVNRWAITLLCNGCKRRRMCMCGSIR